MKCKRIKDLIMSGYIDGELKGNLLKKVEQHLLSCKECKEFEQALQEKVVSPLRQAQEVKPPESVWEAIRETISPKKAPAEGIIASFLRGLDYFFHLPKPALVFATVSAVILLTFIFIRIPFGGQRLASDYFDEQMGLISYLDVNESGSLDFGTTIEEYFM